jgi:GMP synthase (glutamine-hydrolysing)
MVIIKTGDSIPTLVARRGDFEDWIIAGLEKSRPFSGSVVAVFRGEDPPDLDRINGILVTGSHAMVTDRADWSERTAAWLKQAVARGIPVLGICYGHQLLAHALGGKVGYLADGPEYGTVPLALTAVAAGDPLFGTLPQGAGVQTSHYQSVTELPAGAVLLARSDKDPHIAFRYGPCAWGVQFHPEYDGEIAQAYLDEYRKGLKGKVVSLPGPCWDTPTGGVILARFAELVAGGAG